MTVRNDGQAPLGDIELIVESHATGDRALRKEIRILKPGDAVSFRFHELNPTAKLRFRIGGKTFVYDEDFDLWAGEGWILAVDSHGAVSSLYESTAAD
ncbi:MAG: hypothetical protein WD875_05770 [Pirellulales bacterium]